MHEAINLENLISKVIKGLPQERLVEIAEYIFFIRKKAFQPDVFQQEMETELLNEELHLKSQAEVMHLEEEFADYKNLYPKE